jgi:hypothetical protein
VQQCVCAVAAFAAPTAADLVLVLCWVLGGALAAAQRVFTCLYTKHTKQQSWIFLGATAVGKCLVKHLQEPHDFFCLQNQNRATFVLWKFVARFRLQTQ